MLRTRIPHKARKVLVVQGLRSGPCCTTSLHRKPIRRHWFPGVDLYLELQALTHFLPGASSGMRSMKVGKVLSPSLQDSLTMYLQRARTSFLISLQIISPIHVQHHVLQLLTLFTADDLIIIRGTYASHAPLFHAYCPPSISIHLPSRSWLPADVP